MVPKLTNGRIWLPCVSMIEHQTPYEIDDENVVLPPQDDVGDGRLTSLRPKRPMGNSRPVGWIFVGSVKMPCSEHLIPFLH